jgi:hypothetical protein
MFFVKKCNKDIWYNCVAKFLGPRDVTSLASSKKLLYKWLHTHPRVIAFTKEMKIRRQEEEKYIHSQKQRLEAQEIVKKRNEEALKNKTETIAKILKSNPILKEPKDASISLKLKKKGIQFTKGYIQNFSKWSVKSEHLRYHTFKYTFRNKKKQLICSVIKKYVCPSYCSNHNICKCFNEKSVNVTWFI